MPVRASVAGGVLTEDHFVELVTVGGVVAGVLDNGQFTALLTDPRGTPFAGPDGTAGLATPYGVRTSHLGLAEVIDYTRLGWDPDLDIVRMGVRDYDPRLSQFLTPDPLYFEDLDKCQSSPLQCSLYGYAGGNPINFIDPMGLGLLSWLKETAITVARFTVKEVAPRVVGAGKVVGGTAIALGGAALCTTTAGCIIGGAGVLYGADLAGSGAVQVALGTPARTATNLAIGALTNQQTADDAELAFAVVAFTYAITGSPYFAPRAAPAPGTAAKQFRSRALSAEELKQPTGGTGSRSGSGSGGSRRPRVRGDGMSESASLEDSLEQLEGITEAQGAARQSGVGDATIRSTAKSKQNLQNRLNRIRSSNDYTDDD